MLMYISCGRHEDIRSCSRKLKKFPWLKVLGPTGNGTRHSQHGRAEYPRVYHYGPPAMWLPCRFEFTYDHKLLSANDWISARFYPAKHSNLQCRWLQMETFQRSPDRSVKIFLKLVKYENSLFIVPNITSNPSNEVDRRKHFDQFVIWTWILLSDFVAHRHSFNPIISNDFVRFLRWYDEF